MGSVLFRGLSFTLVINAKLEPVEAVSECQRSREQMVEFAFLRVPFIMPKRYDSSDEQKSIVII